MDSYKIFRQLEEREKRKNPYEFYDKDELMDTIIELEDNIEVLQSKIDKAIDKLYCYGEVFDREILQQFQKEMENILKGEDK